MARDLSDRSWSEARDAWQRLVWARRTHGGYPAAADFARKIKMPDNTYRAYERDPDAGSKSIRLEYAQARAWAELLRVRWEWLLEGDGLPFKDDAPSQRIVAALRGRPVEEQERVAAAVEALLGTGTGG